jgi:hypothetical protein
MTIFNSLSIRSRSAVQIIFEFSSIFIYIWVLQKNTQPEIHLPFFWLVCVGFPIFCIARDQQEFPEFSLDWDSFVSCLRGLIWFTVVATAFLVFAALFRSTYHYDGAFLTRFSEYIFWAFLQQIGLQIFLTRRVQNIFKSPVRVSLVAAAVFSSIHFPNLALMVLTWIGGFFWSLSFQRTPNLYAITISHAWLAVIALYTVPMHWMHQFRIGPEYWTYVP